MRALVQGGGVTPLSDATRLQNLLDAGTLTPDRLTDKSKALLLNGEIETGARTWDSLTRKGLNLLVSQGYSPPERMTPAQIVQSLPAYHGVGEMRREYGIPLEQMTPYPYAVGQTIKGAVAPLPVPAQRIAPPRSKAEAALGAVTGMAGTLIGVPALLGGVAAGAVPALAGAARLGTIAATQVGQKALGGEKVTAKEAATTIGISAAIGAAGDLVTPFVHRSISTTLAKHFPEVLSPTMEKALLQSRARAQAQRVA